MYTKVRDVSAAVVVESGVKYDNVERKNTSVFLDYPSHTFDYTPRLGFGLERVGHCSIPDYTNRCIQFDHVISYPHSCARMCEWWVNESFCPYSDTCRRYRTMYAIGHLGRHRACALFANVVGDRMVDHNNCAHTTLYSYVFFHPICFIILLHCDAP